jgi:hypothetical protein
VRLAGLACSCHPEGMPACSRWLSEARAIPPEEVGFPDSCISEGYQRHTVPVASKTQSRCRLCFRPDLSKKPIGFSIKPMDVQPTPVSTYPASRDRGLVADLDLIDDAVLSFIGTDRRTLDSVSKIFSV